MEHKEDRAADPASPVPAQSTAADARPRVTAEEMQAVVQLTGQQAALVQIIANATVDEAKAKEAREKHVALLREVRERSEQVLALVSARTGVSMPISINPDGTVDHRPR